MSPARTSLVLHRTLRKATRGTVLALALAVVGVGIRVVCPTTPEHDAAASVSPVEELRAANRRASSRADDGAVRSLAPLLASIRRMYGESPAPAPVPARGAVEPTSAPDAPLPLAMLRVVTLYSSADGIVVAGLRSKDPARPESYAVRLGDDAPGLRLVAVRFGDTHAELDVVRGEEHFTHRFSLRKGSEARVSMFPGLDRRAGTASPAARAKEPAPVATTRVRLLPFFGDDGRRIGVRVIALEPKSPLARAGVARGDAILTIDGDAVADLTALSDRLATGWTPRRVVLARGGDSTRRTDLEITP
jgi:hypothetical protein